MDFEAPRNCEKFQIREEGGLDSQTNKKIASTKGNKLAISTPKKQLFSINGFKIIILFFSFRWHFSYFNLIIFYSRFNLIYLTLILHGVGTLMPWNMFITAKEVIMMLNAQRLIINNKNIYITNIYISSELLCCCFFCTPQIDLKTVTLSLLHLSR